ncbi:MAG TPA: mechanosensitive ion channel domain-containing protein [Sphingomicrobium sp.]
MNLAPAANAAAGASPDALKLFGVTLIGATPENLRKLVLSVLFIAIALLAAWLLRRLFRLSLGSRAGTRFYFWARQALSLLIAVIMILGIASIWFDSPQRLATVLGLVTAGVAFALQRVVTAVAGYFVILRGKTFNVGDRIVMGGVRGDVIALSFMQTKIMEMGQPPPVQKDEPAMWVKSRQFTGRIVTVTNDKIFDEPVYNYTDQFPYVWDEISLGIHYEGPHEEVEQLLIDAARRHALCSEHMAQDEVRNLERRYNLAVGDIDPRVYWRITDNWLELTVRFLCPDHGVRDIKDAMSRDILKELNRKKISIASTSFEIAGTPTLRIQRQGRGETNAGA